MKAIGILKSVKKHFTCILMLGASCFTCSAVDAQLIDDFEGTLSGYTSTAILDVNGGASNTSTWEIVGGELGFTTTSYDDIEQHAYIRDGVSLAVGQELQLDMILPLAGTARNFGLYVGGTAPSFNVRQDYISIYGESGSTVLRSRGFDGTTEYDVPTVNATAGADRMFIARTGVNEFDAGFYSGLVRTVFATRIPATANTADFVGFYADVREAGTVGFGDNLTIDPIPTVLAGDFDGNGVVDCADLDGYVGNIDAAAEGALAALDLDVSGTIEASDADRHIRTLIETPNGVVGTFPGDLNCDGTVDVLGDAFALVGSLGTSVTMYSQGDINFDGQVDVLGDAFILVGNLSMTNQ